MRGSKQRHVPVLLVRQWRAVALIPFGGLELGLGSTEEMGVEGDWRGVRVEALRQCGV